MPPSELREQTRVKAVGLSGISDTGRGHVCPCGAVHHRPRVCRAPPRPAPEAELRDRLYEAMVSGKLDLDENRHVARYCGDCERPVEVVQNSDRGNLFVAYKVRCRQCPACLRARQFYWAKAAVTQTLATDAAGLRTWFGTLTFRPDVQQNCRDMAMMKWADRSSNGRIPHWWDLPKCDERFRLVRDEMVQLTKLYWKRLRKGVKRCEHCYPKAPAKGREWDHPPAKFKYFLVFERHSSGLPHVHWLLHEVGTPILQNHLACAWQHGFTKIKVLKGDNLGKAGFYVAKYLGKAIQARQIASLGYANSVPPP